MGGARERDVPALGLYHRDGVGCSWFTQYFDSIHYFHYSYLVVIIYHYALVYMQV